MKKKIFLLLALIGSLILCIVACSNDPQMIQPPGPNPEEPTPVDPVDPTTPLKMTYSESFDVFCNPERGFYTYKKFVSNQDENKPLTVDFVKQYRNQGITLIFMTHLMKDFLDKPISDEYLEMIRTNLQVLRDGGSKTVMRFCYSDQQEAEVFDAPWEITENHIKQLKPIFEEYVDVISVLEAGFIGAWGEWYYTTNYIYQPKDDEYGPRKQVLTALLDALPKERMISVRYPKAKLLIYGISHTDSITIDEAYNGSDLARVSAHNDCVFADQDDRGTFGNNRNHRKYWANESRYYVMGGESCCLSEYANCDQALPVLKEYHWSYLNINYHSEVLNHWKTNGCFDEIERNLGYRFVLIDGEFDRQVKVGDSYNMNVNLKNVGYAAPYNPRNIEVVIVSETDPNSKHVVKLDNDPRFWFTDLQVNLDLEIKLPTSLKSGKYNLYLNLPDPKDVLADKPEFSIRLANENVWESETGYNKLCSFDIVD